MKKQEIKIKQELTCQETVDLFNEVGKSISEGVLTIEYGDKKISLKPGCRFDTTIEASSKKSKQKLMIEITWKEGDDVCVNKPALRISSDEPLSEDGDEQSAVDEETVEEDEAESAVDEDAIRENGPTEGEPEAETTGSEDLTNSKTDTDEKMTSEAPSDAAGSENLNASAILDSLEKSAAEAEDTTDTKKDDDEEKLMKY